MNELSVLRSGWRFASHPVTQRALASVAGGLPLALAWSGLLLRAVGGRGFVLALIAFLPLWMALAWMCHAIERVRAMWMALALLALATAAMAWAGPRDGGWA